jgi:2,4-dienoyl-CoA reductase (NADPH2)
VGDGKLVTDEELSAHKKLTHAVHEAAPDCKIIMQILHMGMYTFQTYGMSPSGERRPNSPTIPKVMTEEDILETIQDHVRCAVLCREAGYDGIELKVSGGYLLNSFVAPLTNKRTDKWGGSPENRRRLPMEILHQIREAVGPDFLIFFRQTVVELVTDGSTTDEIFAMAKNAIQLGANVISAHIGWHQARVPTIASFVPKAAWVDFAEKLKDQIDVPLVSANRINDPQTAEDILAAGKSDLIAMARPFLADPEFVNKAAAGKPQSINTCIACNQGCMDYVFDGGRCTCLVNPRAGRESEMTILPANSQKRIAVVGAGPAGLAAATIAAERGHAVTIYEADDKIGGQFNMAKRVPGKEEYSETIRYFGHKIETLGIDLRLSTTVGDMTALENEYDDVILATGVTPRIPEFSGVDHPKVMTYIDALYNRKPVGQRVAIIGAGGIGFDVSEYITHEGVSSSLDKKLFFEEWGVDPEFGTRGGLASPMPPLLESPREVYLLQRKASKLGAGLGKTSGWIHWSIARRIQVNMLSGCTYVGVNDDGLVYEQDGQQRLLEVDNVILCSGQISERSLYVGYEESDSVHLIGGAHIASELDALRAIREGTELAMKL